MCPVLWSPAAVGDRPDCDYGFFFGIDKRERESPEQESPGVVLSEWPAFRGLTDCVSGSMQFFDEVQGRSAACLSVPSDCALDICDRALMVLNTSSAHSPGPRVRDAVLPKGRSLLCPLSDLRCDAPPPCPKPLGQIHSSPQDCLAGCWPRRHARQPRGRAPVLEDQKFLDSLPYFNTKRPCTILPNTPQYLVRCLWPRRLSGPRRLRRGSHFCNERAARVIEWSE